MCKSDAEKAFAHCIIDACLGFCVNTFSQKFQVWTDFSHIQDGVSFLH